MVLLGGLTSYSDLGTQAPYRTLFLLRKKMQSKLQKLTFKRSTSFWTLEVAICQAEWNFISPLKMNQIVIMTLDMALYLTLPTCE